MRCSNCGKRIKKRSNFCIKCGAKVPPVLKKDKKNKNISKTKKKLRTRIIKPAAIVILVALVSFLFFSCDSLKEKVAGNKVYQQVSQTVQDKLPFDLPKLPKLPFDLPELPKELPFKLPSPSKLLGDKEPPDEEQILDDLKEYLEKESDIQLHHMEIESRDSEEEGKEETIVATAEATSDEGKETKQFSMLYKRGLLGGWKLKEVEDSETAGEKKNSENSEKLADAKVSHSKDEKESDSKEGKETPKGVDSKTVLADENLYQDLPSDWTYSNVKVIAHSYDEKTGTDRVIVYMELKTAYVYLTGTKELTYKLDSETGEWKSTGPASKLAALSIEPISIPGQETGTNMPV